MQTRTDNSTENKKPEAGQFALELLPAEVLNEVIPFLEPRSQVPLVSRQLNSIFTDNYQRYWRACFKRHFPHLYNNVRRKKNVDWYVKFKAAEEKEYANLSPEHAELFRLVKEGDVEGLRAHGLRFNNLFLFDSSENKLRDWVTKTGNQDLMDYCFEVVLQNYLSADGVTVVLDRVDMLGNTILIWAARFNQLDKIIDFIASGCAVNHSAEQSHVTPLLLAANNGFLNLVIYLTDNLADISWVNNEGKTALHAAAQRNHLQVVKYLISIGADVHAVSHQQMTPLLCAIERGYLDTVVCLVENGAEVNLAANSGFTPLMLAAQNDHPKVAAYLLEQGANINAATANGGTALFVAAQEGCAEVVRILLETNKADINAPLRTTHAALIQFVESHLPEVQQRTRIFLATQADPQNILVRPEDIAGIMGHENIVDMLQQKQNQLQNRLALRS